MGYISIAEASERLGVTPRSIRLWIRYLKQTDPTAYGLHIRVRTQPDNPGQEVYELNEDLLKEFEEKVHTQIHTQVRTPSDTPQKAESERQVNPDMSSIIIDTLRREIERQGETLRQILQDHAKERERADTIIMGLRNDMHLLNERIFLLTEGKEQEPETPPETPGQVVDETLQENPRQETPPGDSEYMRVTVFERLWLWKQGITEDFKQYWLLIIAGFIVSCIFWSILFHKIRS